MKAILTPNEKFLLEILRKKKTPYSFSKDAGVTRQSVASWIKNDNEPRKKNREKISNHCGMTVGDWRKNHTEELTYSELIHIYCIRYEVGYETISYHLSVSAQVVGLIACDKYNLTDSIIERIKAKLIL